LEDQHPFVNEVGSDGTFIYPNQVPDFFGQQLPANFIITYKGEELPTEGEIVGYDRLGGNLIFKKGSVVVKSGDRR
jgi:hypothetical protein